MKTRWNWDTPIGVTEEGLKALLDATCPSCNDDPFADCPACYERNRKAYAVKSLLRRSEESSALSPLALRLADSVRDDRMH